MNGVPFADEMRHLTTQSTTTFEDAGSALQLIGVQIRAAAPALYATEIKLPMTAQCREAITNQLASMGYVVYDTKDGIMVTWK